MNSEVGFCRKALQAFEENGISIEHMPSGIDTMTVFVHQAEFEGKEQQVISSIRRLAHPDIIDLESDLALIAVVGKWHEVKPWYSRQDFLCTCTCQYQCAHD